MAIYCPNCGIELPDNVSFCDACGTPLKNSAPAAQASGSPSSGHMGSVVCPVCNAAALPGEAFCDNCGAPLLPATAYAPPADSSLAATIVTGPPAVVPAAPVPVSSAPSMGRQISASLVVTQPPPPATIPVPERAEQIVGRADPQSNSYPDIDLGPYGGLDLGVSRRHFRLTRTGDQFYVEDLGSMNGTVVNGQRLPPYTLQPLRSGDRITLGKMEINFEIA